MSLLLPELFCFLGKIIYFYDFQMNPLPRNNLIVREKFESTQEKYDSSPCSAQSDHAFKNLLYLLHFLGRESTQLHIHIVIRIVR